MSFFKGIDNFFREIAFVKIPRINLFIAQKLKLDFFVEKKSLELNLWLFFVKLTVDRCSLLDQFLACKVLSDFHRIKTKCGLTNSFREINSNYYTVWKSSIKRDHDFYGKINIFSVKSTFLPKTLLKHDCVF